MGGPPLPDALTIFDNRILTGTVLLTIAPDGTATLTGNFHVFIHDVFDFKPAGLGNSLFTAVAVIKLGDLEDLGETADVPFDVNFDANPVQSTFHIPIPTKNEYRGNAVLAMDPNDLLGPAGFGTQEFIQAIGVLPYTIDFENDGTAAAQDVTVSEQLDPNLDWSTFQLGSFGFGTVNVSIPAGLTQYETTVSYENTDGSSLNVQVALDFDVQTGLLTVTFTSLDPLTGEAPTGVFDGFLYPEASSGNKLNVLSLIL